jgi:hypothetical protein
MCGTVNMDKDEPMQFATDPRTRDRGVFVPLAARQPLIHDIQQDV